MAFGNNKYNINFTLKIAISSRPTHVRENLTFKDRLLISIGDESMQRIFKPRGSKYIPMA